MSDYLYDQFNKVLYRKVPDPSKKETTTQLQPNVINNQYIDPELIGPGNITENIYVNNQVIGSGGTPGGNDKTVQFNDDGNLNGDDNLTWDKTTHQDLYIGQLLSGGSLITLHAGLADDTQILSNGGGFNICVKDGAGDRTISLTAGNSTYSGDPGGTVFIQAGWPDSNGDGGGIQLITTQGDGSGNASGDIRLTILDGVNGARQGRVLITNDTISSERWVTTGATTDANPTAIPLFTISGNVSVIVEAKIIARRTGGSAGAVGDSAAYVRRVAFKTIGGVTSIIGAVQDSFTVEDQAGWDVDFNILTNTANLLITGATNNNIAWWMEIFVIPTATIII